MFADLQPDRDCNVMCQSRYAAPKLFKQSHLVYEYRNSMLYNNNGSLNNLIPHHHQITSSKNKTQISEQITERVM